MFPLATRWYHRTKHFAHAEASLPYTYRLGAGHVKFFYDKLEFLRRRHAELANEMRNRGYQSNHDMHQMCRDLSEYMQKDWLPRHRDIRINIKRLDERIPGWYK